MKKILISLSIFSVVFNIFVFSAGSALAVGLAPRSTEVQYIPVPGATTPATTDIELPEYVKYLYYFVIIASGLVALGIIIFSGFIYVSSAGAPEAMKDAKDRILAALTGLFILLLSGIIFNTISPSLFKIKPIVVSPILVDISPGVYLCKKAVPIIQFWNERKTLLASPTQEGADQLSSYTSQINENCILNPGDVSGDFIDQGKFIYLVPSWNKQQYGAIVYQESGFGGKASIFYGDGNSGVEATDQPTAWNITSRAGSVKMFILNLKGSPSSYAALYEDIEFNRWSPALRPEVKQLPANVGAEGFDLKPNQEIGSLKIEGSIFVIFLKVAGEWTSDTDLDVYTVSDPNLNDNNLMGQWNPACNKPRPGFNQDYENFPCASGMVIVSTL